MNNVDDGHGRQEAPQMRRRLTGLEAAGLLEASAAAPASAFLKRSWLLGSSTTALCRALATTALGRAFATIGDFLDASRIGVSFLDMGSEPMPSASASSKSSKASDGVVSTDSFRLVAGVDLRLVLTASLGRPKGMMRGLAAFGIDFGLGDGGLGAGDGLAAFVAGDAFGTRAAAGAFFEGGALWGVAATDDFLPCDVLLDGTCSGHLHSLPSSANE
mmetsp:Transcript_37758/g.55454  ORF Transcript_37758/g.55454 Transcript_37758/m.55454 type:complete len:217 (-) Transcript_37758:870-1520(-)